jgi:transposase InsO family protein
MPWKETCAVDQKMKFVSAVSEGVYSFAELCRQFGISRKSGYALWNRYQSEGPVALQPRSSAPHSHPNATDARMIEQLLDVKRRYPLLSAGKVRDWLRLHRPDQVVPARSTVSELFKRYGLIQPRKRGRRNRAQGTPLSHATLPNAVWSVDSKGQFRMGNGRWCYPLTVSDNASRYLLVCHGMHRPLADSVRRQLDRAFRDYGLPDAIRSDNGAPFASSVSLGGLSRLAIWWLKLGIRVERIRPGHPEQNPRHERMHKTLKADIGAPRHNLRAQQRCFDIEVEFFNEQRPHDSLGGVPPSYRYVRSLRNYNGQIDEPEYPEGFLVRRVRHNGEIKWRGDLLFVSEALVGESIALQPLDDDRWQLYFCSMPLGVLNLRTKKIER